MKKSITLICATLFFCLNIRSQVNIITNGDFENGLSIGWFPESNEGTMNVTITNENPITNSKSMHIKILTSQGTNINTDSWKQKIRWILSMSKNAEYKLSFKARASNNIQIATKYQLPFWPYTTYFSNTYDLTTNTKTFEYTLPEGFPETLGSACINFKLGHLPAGTEIWLDDVTLIETTNVVGNICNGDFENDVQNLPYSGGMSLIYGWTKNIANSYDFAFDVDDATPISGTKSLKITNHGNPADAGWRVQAMWTHHPIVGKKYILEFKARSSTTFDIVAESFTDFPRNNDLFQTWYRITPELNSYTIELPENAVTEYRPYFLGFWLGLLPKDATIWLDDIKYYQYNSVTTNKIEIKDDKNVIISSASNLLLIEVPTKSIINIYSLTGQQIKSQTALKGKTQLHLNKGTYIVQVLDNNAITKSSKVYIY